MASSGAPPSTSINQSSIDKARLVDFHEITRAAWDQKLDLEKVIHIQSPCKDDNSDIKGIQRILKNLQSDVERIKRFSNINSAFDALTNENEEPWKSIKSVINFSAIDISAYVKNIMNRIRSWTMIRIQDEAKKKLPFLFPGEMPKFIDELNEVLNLVSCAFGKVMESLVKNVVDLLFQLIDKSITGPICLAENFIDNLLDNILGPINDALSIVGNIAGGISTALDFAIGVLNFFKCDEDKSCPSVQEITLSGQGQNNPQGGNPPISINFSGNSPQTSNSPVCSTEPQPCGPPLVQISGGKGFGAIANAVISPVSSSVIGFDIINSGSNYVTSPKASIIDECGSGSGSSLLVQMEPYEIGTETTETETTETGTTETKLRVKNIVVLSPGNGYLSAPNGSLGGNGRIWKFPNECYVKTADSRYYVVPDCNPTNLQPGDTLFTPRPPSDSSTYPIVTEIDEIYIDDPGFGYEPGDTIEVVPNNGAILEPIINQRGEISKVNVIKPGVGFIDLPKIIVNSPRGYNAKLIPVLRVIPLDDISNLSVIPDGTQLITVVDCVGKIPNSKNSFRIPR